MWRAFFLAIGVYLVLLGAQGLAVEKVVLRSRAPAQVRTDIFGNRTVEPGAQRTMAPPNWVPWTLITSGS